MNKSFMTAMAGLMIILGIMSQLDKYLQDSKYGFLINLFVFMVGLNIILMVYLIMSYDEVISKPGVKGPKGLPGRQGDYGAGDTCGLCKPRPNNFERDREKVIIKKSIISGLDCSKCKVRYVKFRNDDTPRIGYQTEGSAKTAVWEINKTLDYNSNSRIHWGRVILPMGYGYQSSDIPWRSQTSYSKILNGPMNISSDGGPKYYGPYKYSKSNAIKKCKDNGYTGLCKKKDLTGHSRCAAGWVKDGCGWWYHKTKFGCGKRRFNKCWNKGKRPKWGAYCCGSRKSVNKKCKSKYPKDSKCWKNIFGYPAMETGLPPKEAFEDLYKDEQAAALMFYDHPDTGGEVWFKIGIPSSIIRKNELIDSDDYQRQRVILKDDCPDFCDLQS